MTEAPRCQHLKSNGIRCGSPALRGQAFCYNHALIHDPRTPLGVPGYQLPPLECQEDIQLAMRDAVQSYLDKRLNDIQARTVIYAISVVAPYACRPRSIRHDLIATEIPPAMLRSAGEPPRSDGAPFKPSVGLSGVVNDEVLDAGRLRPATPADRPERSAGDPPAVSRATSPTPEPDMNKGAPFKPSVGLSGVVNNATTTAPCHPERGRTSEPKDPLSIETSNDAPTLSNHEPINNNQSPINNSVSTVAVTPRSSDHPITRSPDAPKPPRRVYDPVGCLSFLTSDH